MDHCTFLTDVSCGWSLTLVTIGAREVPTFFMSLSVGQGPADIKAAIVWHAGDVDKLDHIFDNIPRPQGAWSVWSRTFSSEVTIHHHPMFYLN